MLTCIVEARLRQNKNVYYCSFHSKILYIMLVYESSDAMTYGIVGIYISTVSVVMSAIHSIYIEGT